MTNDERRYHLEEYKALREEILKREDIDHLTQRLALLFIGGFYAWAISAEPNNGLARFVFIAPTLVSIAAGMRIWNSVHYFNIISDYIQIIEKRFLGEGSFGWEHFIRNCEQIKCVDRRNRWTDRLLWLGLIFGSFAIFVSRFFPAAPGSGG